MDTKHAYCILAHTDRECLISLISCLDDERNDIFIIPDKKSTTELTQSLKVKKSKLYILPPENRVDIKWGDLSMVEAELQGFEFILSNGNYQYIHLISGQDLPIKSQNQIHEYFSKLPKGTNLIGIAQSEYNQRDLEYKTRYYHFFIRQYRNKNFLVRNTLKILRKLLVRAQKLCRVKRHWCIGKLYKGSQWVSITSEMASYFVDNRDHILRNFKYVPCVDEIYKQTLAMNSDFKSTLLAPDKDFAAETRIIDWKRGLPYTWRVDDFDELISSEALFARKFNSRIDKAIIRKITEYVLKNT